MIEKWAFFFTINTTRRSSRDLSTQGKIDLRFAEIALTTSVYGAERRIETSWKKELFFLVNYNLSANRTDNFSYGFTFTFNYCKLTALVIASRFSTEETHATSPPCARYARHV